MSTEQVCENCNGTTSTDPCEHCGAELSDVEAKMEALVRAASIPNLAGLYGRGKKRGWIKPHKDYTTKV